MSQTIEQIARAHGEKIFNGLLTITNENGEIRTCHLVTTTGHSQSSIALDASSKSLTTYGRSQPKAFYTDNVQGDRQLLESSFESSLLKELVRIEPHGHLEILRIPDDVQVRVIREEREIDLVCSRIIGELQGMAEGEDLVVGFDSEWNVDFVANDRFQHHGPTSIVQLAYKDTVYILQVRLSCHFVSYETSNQSYALLDWRSHCPGSTPTTASQHPRARKDPKGGKTGED